MLNLEDKKHLLNSSDRSYRALSWFECLHEHLKIAKMGIFEFFCSELLKCGKGLWRRLFFFFCAIFGNPKKNCSWSIVIEVSDK